MWKITFCLGKLVKLVNTIFCHSYPPQADSPALFCIQWISYNAFSGLQDLCIMQDRCIKWKGLQKEYSQMNFRKKQWKMSDKKRYYLIWLSNQGLSFIIDSGVRLHPTFSISDKLRCLSSADCFGLYRRNLLSQPWLNKSCRRQILKAPCCLSSKCMWHISFHLRELK